MENESIVKELMNDFYSVCYDTLDNKDYDISTVEKLVSTYNEFKKKYDYDNVVACCRDFLSMIYDSIDIDKIVISDKNISDSIKLDNDCYIALKNGLKYENCLRLTNQEIYEKLLSGIANNNLSDVLYSLNSKDLEHFREQVVKKFPTKYSDCKDIQTFRNFILGKKIVRNINPRRVNLVNNVNISQGYFTSSSTSNEMPTYTVGNTKKEKNLYYLGIDNILNYKVSGYRLKVSNNTIIDRKYCTNIELIKHQGIVGIENIKNHVLIGKYNNNLVVDNEIKTNTYFTIKELYIILCYMLLDDLAEENWISFCDNYTYNDLIEVNDKNFVSQGFTNVMQRDNYNVNVKVDTILDNYSKSTLEKVISNFVAISKLLFGTEDFQEELNSFRFLVPKLENLRPKFKGDKCKNFIYFVEEDYV